MTPTFGPYETESAAAAEPMPAAVRNLPDNRRPNRDSRDLQLSYLRGACADAGVELGRYDERILTWLANYEPAVVQVFIGLISRAYDAGLRDGGA